MIVRRWPEGRPRVLVSDAWLANAGDGAIALATERRLREVLPGAAVVHAAYQSHVLADRYPQLALAPPLEALAGANPSAPEAAGWASEDLERLVEGADMVLSQGGGFAFERYGPRDRLAAWALVAERGIPLAICAQSIGRFADAEMRHALRTALTAAAAVTLRDRVSAQFVQELAPGVAVSVTADEAFLLTSRPPGGNGHRAGAAVVLSDSGEDRADGMVAPSMTADAAADLLRGVLRAVRPEPVHVFSTAQGLARLDSRAEDDGAFAARALAQLEPVERAGIRFHASYHTPAAVLARLRSVRAVVTHRLHPAVLALGVGTPALVTSRAFKATRMLTDLGLDRWLAPARDAAAVLERLQAALAPRAPRDRALWETLEPARAAARRNDHAITAPAARAAARRG